MWWCNRLENEHVVTKIAEVITNQVSCVLGHDQITPKSLRSGLPRINFEQRTAGIYSIIGSHKDSRCALYVGSSGNVPERIMRHVWNIQALRNGGSQKNIQHCHRILAENGWTITYHALAVFTQSTSFIWIHLLETLFIVIFKSIASEQRGKAHTEACAELWNKLVQHGLPIFSSSIDEDSQSLTIPVIGLNRCLPIKAGFIGSHAKFKRTCEQCGAQSSRSWYPYDKKRPFESYICLNCYGYVKRGLRRPKAQQDWVEQKHALEASHPVVGPCDSCGSTENTYRCLKLGKILCHREIVYYRLYGRLNPTESKARSLKKSYPVILKCHSCDEDSKTAVNLRRHTGTGMVLCAREVVHWQMYRILTPVRQPRNKKCQNPGCVFSIGRRVKLQWSPELKIWHCYELGGKDVRCVPKDKSIPFKFASRGRSRRRS